jgi:hypothetical protein
MKSYSIQEFQTRMGGAPTGGAAQRRLKPASASPKAEETQEDLPIRASTARGGRVGARPSGQFGRGPE